GVVETAHACDSVRILLSRNRRQDGAADAVEIHPHQQSVHTPLGGHGETLPQVSVDVDNVVPAVIHCMPPVRIVRVCLPPAASTSVEAEDTSRVATQYCGFVLGTDVGDADHLETQAGFSVRQRTAEQ